MIIILLSLPRTMYLHVQLPLLFYPLYTIFPFGDLHCRCGQLVTSGVLIFRIEIFLSSWKGSGQLSELLLTVPMLCPDFSALAQTILFIYLLQILKFCLIKEVSLGYLKYKIAPSHHILLLLLSVVLTILKY